MARKGNWTQGGTMPDSCHRGHPLTPNNVYTYKSYRACRQCRLDRCKSRRQANPEGYRAEWKRWTIENPQKYKKHVLRLYGMTPEEFDRKLVDQAGLCAICRDRAAREVDHNHDTGRVRGLLCHRCNILVGAIERNQSRLNDVLAYLERWA